MPNRLHPRSWWLVCQVLVRKMWLCKMRVRQIVTAGMAATVLSGCGGFHLIYTPTGQALSGYAETHNTPYVLEMHDVGIACSLGLALDPLLYSFSRVTVAPENTGTLLQVLAGICGEREAQYEELRYLRAGHQDVTEEIQDARTAMQRRYEVNAGRRLASFNRAMRAFAFDPSADVPVCPCYRNNQDELTFMLGLVSGLQAVMDDAKGGGGAGVSRGLALQIERAATCLDNTKWAGLPGNLRALVWSLLPDSRPDEITDPWASMADNRQLAMNGGMRTAIVLELVMAENLGRNDTIAEVLALLAASEGDFQVNPEYRMVDLAGMEIARFVSDRVWTRRYGYSTPLNRFGRVSDERPARENIDTDGLL
ncbi:MAG: hypothetical protein EA349_07250 [Halomonadaceae bacterium]|nr:MAG: hypothetical protein EA349_07250 [Halomonadaceae bacterium]